MASPVNLSAWQLDAWYLSASPAMAQPIQFTADEVRPILARLSLPGNLGRLGQFENRLHHENLLARGGICETTVCANRTLVRVGNVCVDRDWVRGEGRAPLS